MGPIGVGALNLYGRPGKVILQTSNGRTYVDKSPEHLLAKGWGYNVPVSHLKYWIRGLPSPDMSMNTRYDANGRLRTLIQQGWVIQYLSYVRHGKYNLPSKIFIRSPSLQVKIVIYQWQVSSG
jgi:outer membrane lipoprotein LolB